MRRVTPLVVLILLSATACANAAARSEPTPAPAASNELDPVGMYDFVASLGIEARTGTLQIQRSDTGGLRGEAWLEGEGDPAMIQSGAVSGNHVSLFALVQGSLQVSFELDFAGTAFSGLIIAGGDSIAVDGTRRP